MYKSAMYFKLRFHNYTYDIRRDHVKRVSPSAIVKYKFW
jgi:hypothetical protein